MNANDERFATEAIRRGLITISVLEEVKAVQKQLGEIGLNESIAEVLVKRNHITRAQADSILSGGKSDGKFVIPGYQVNAKIGSGGMGTVYRATQLSINRPVAIKVLSEKLGGDPQSAERFAREAKNLAKLNHVNIVTAIDAGNVGKLMYFVMEYVEGESLGGILKRRKRLPETEALHVAVQTARALEHANAHGIIHRDVKPDNILMTKDGVAKLTDLGLAKTKGEDANLTQTGIAIGTPNYISPEQARGEKDLDTRCDIYSLGATIYHMVAGEAPFKGSSALEVVTKHLTEQLPSPKKLNPSLSEGICIVIEKMMAKRREDRYQDPRELLGDLELVIDGKMPKVRRPGGVTTRTAARPLSLRPAPAGTASRGTRRPPVMGKKSSPVPLLAAVGGGIVVLVVVLMALPSKERRTELRDERPTDPIVRHETPVTPPIPKAPDRLKETPDRTPSPDNAQKDFDRETPRQPVQPVRPVREPWRTEAEMIVGSVRGLLLQGEFRGAANEFGKLTVLRLKYPEMKFDDEKTLAAEIERQAGEHLGNRKKNVLAKIAQTIADGEYEAIKKELESDKRKQLTKNESEIDALIVAVGAKREEARSQRAIREQLAEGERKLLADAWRQKVLPLLEKWDFGGAAKAWEGEGRIATTGIVKKDFDERLEDLRKIDAFLSGLWDQKKIVVGGVDWELKYGSKGERYVTVKGRRTDMRRDKEESREFLEQIVRAKNAGFPGDMADLDREALALFYTYNGDRKTAVAVATAAAVASPNKGLTERIARLEKSPLPFPAPKMEDVFAYARDPKVVAGGAPPPDRKPLSKKKEIGLIVDGKFETSPEGKAFLKGIEERGTTSDEYFRLVKEHKYDEIKEIIYQEKDGYVVLARRKSMRREIPPQYLSFGDATTKDFSADMDARLKMSPEAIENGIEIWFRADDEMKNGILVTLKPRSAIELEKGKDGKAKLKINPEELAKLLQKELILDIQIAMVRDGDRKRLSESEAPLKVGDADSFHSFQWRIEGDRLEIFVDRHSLVAYTDREKRFPKEGRSAFGIITGAMARSPEEFGLHIKNLSYTSK